MLSLAGWEDKRQLESHPREGPAWCLGVGTRGQDVYDATEGTTSGHAAVVGMPRWQPRVSATQQRRGSCEPPRPRAPEKGPLRLLTHLHRLDTWTSAFCSYCIQTLISSSRKKKKTHINTCPGIFRIASLMVAKAWKKPRVHHWINKIWSIHATERHSVTERSEGPIQVRMRVNPENITVSEGSPHKGSSIG